MSYGFPPTDDQAPQPARPAVNRKLLFVVIAAIAFYMLRGGGLPANNPGENPNQRPGPIGAPRPEAPGDIAGPGRPLPRTKPQGAIPGGKNSESSDDWSLDNVNTQTTPEKRASGDAQDADDDWSIEDVDVQQGANPKQSPRGAKPARTSAGDEATEEGDWTIEQVEKK